MDDYKFNAQHEGMHNAFNNECGMTNIDINNFKSLGSMTSIVQNCPYNDGIQHLTYIRHNYPNILDTHNIQKWLKYDSIGGKGLHQCILGLSPKVFSYIKEILIMYTIYLIPNNIIELNNILVIGGGYGMEMVLLYDVLTYLGIKVNHIHGVDMKNVAMLQNYFFEQTGTNNICKSYDSSFEINDIDLIYSNCCLAEVSPKINYEYFNKYFMSAKKSYIVWTHLFADIPKYYKEYASNILEQWNLDHDINTLLIK